jgi:hypothetical protein
MNDATLADLRKLAEDARKYLEDPNADQTFRFNEMNLFNARLTPGIVADIIRELQLLKQAIKRRDDITIPALLFYASPGNWSIYDYKAPGFEAYIMDRISRTDVSRYSGSSMIDTEAGGHTARRAIYALEKLDGDEKLDPWGWPIGTDFSKKGPK